MTLSEVLDRSREFEPVERRQLVVSCGKHAFWTLAETSDRIGLPYCERCWTLFSPRDWSMLNPPQP